MVGFNVVKYIIGAVICLLWFLVIHAIKLFRMYLVLLEQKINFRKFVFAYCRTTLANLIIPFKLGELYRMIVFSRLTHNAGVGIGSVIVDRFFDTLALVLILIPLHVLYPGKVSAVSVFLAVFVAVTVFVFVIFPSAYKYLNKYIIINRESRNSMAVLKWLEVLDSGYEYVNRLVRGRYALITLMSFGAWVLEGGLLYAIAFIIGAHYDAGVFSDYITSIMSATSNELQTKYILFSVAVMAVCTMISGIASVSRRGGNEKGNSSIR